jgi:hypothetical protein
MNLVEEAPPQGFLLGGSRRRGYDCLTLGIGSIFLELEKLA